MISIKRFGSALLDRFCAPHIMDRVATVSGTTNLLDILDRILDKGLVVAGDVRISLANVELLTIRIRLLVCSVDKAEQIGLNWWKFDPSLSGSLGAPAQPRQRSLPAPAPTARRDNARAGKKAAARKRKVR